MALTNVSSLRVEESAVTSEGDRAGARGDKHHKKSQI